MCRAGAACGCGDTAGAGLGLAVGVAGVAAAGAVVVAFVAAWWLWLVAAAVATGAVTLAAVWALSRRRLLVHRAVRPALPLSVRLKLERAPLAIEAPKALPVDAGRTVLAAPRTRRGGR